MRSESTADVCGESNFRHILEADGNGASQTAPVNTFNSPVF